MEGRPKVLSGCGSGARERNEEGAEEEHEDTASGRSTQRMNELVG